MKYLIIDIANQLNTNSYVRVPEPEMLPIAAITLTLYNISKVFNMYKCDHVVICCEGGSWRKVIYPEYKAHRKIKALQKTEKEKEESKYFFSETDKFINFIKEKTNATVLKEQMIEGDDFVARWIQTHPSDEHIILSNDTDFIQLLSDNVDIYNPMGKYLLTKEYALNDEGSIAYVEKIITENKDNIKVKMKRSFPVEVPDPEYELFKKCIRGDAGDNIMSAYPRCRENSTKNKVGIKEAYEDRFNKGIEWNMFMLTEWNKVVGIDSDGEPIKKKVKVMDEYNINKELIDLSMQPDDIKDIMDAAIYEEENKNRRTNVGIELTKICNQMDLFKIKENIMEYSKIFNYGVKHGSKNI